MNREWVTLAFGIILVAAVVAVSIWQNYPREAAETDRPETSAVPTDSPESKPAIQPESKPTIQSPAPTIRPTPGRPEPPAATPAGRVDARVSVVHKHRFGDCEGTLRAVPGMLTYTTTNAEDAFRIPFAEVETFELDNDSKNLRVRRRGGRTWNFTTRDDSPTALVAFHKEAARARR